MLTIYPLFGSFKLVTLHYCFSAAIEGAVEFFLPWCTSSELTLSLLDLFC